MTKKIFLLLIFTVPLVTFALDVNNKMVNMEQVNNTGFVNVKLQVTGDDSSFLGTSIGFSILGGYKFSCQNLYGTREAGENGSFRLNKLPFTEEELIESIYIKSDNPNGYEFPEWSEKPDNSSYPCVLSYKGGISEDVSAVVINAGLFNISYVNTAKYKNNAGSFNMVKTPPPQQCPIACIPGEPCLVEP